MDACVGKAFLYFHKYIHRKCTLFTQPLEFSMKYKIFLLKFVACHNLLTSLNGIFSVVSMYLDCDGSKVNTYRNSI